MVDFYGKSFPKLLRHAKNTLLNPEINLYLRYGLLTYLIPVGTQLGKRIFNKYLYEKSSIIQGLLLPEIIRNFEPNNYIKIIKQALIRTKLEAPLIGVFLLAYENIKYYGLKISTKIKSPVRNCLITLGLAKSQNIPQITPFQEIFNTRFNLNICNWKKYLKKDFLQAHHILIIAERAYNSNSSSWLCLVDSINYIIVRNIINSNKTITQKIQNYRGELIPYGSLLDSNSQFSKKYKVISDIFRNIHKRRCSIPEAHPFETKTTKKSTFLKPGERNHYFGKLKIAYFEVDVFFKSI